MFNFLLAASFLLLGTSSENKTLSRYDTIKGKLVYKSCATAVIQITDSSHFYLGQLKWKRTPADQEYEHVFVVKNKCSLWENKIEREQEFYFTLSTEESLKQTCKECMFYDYPPNKVLTIAILRKID